jgi:two-component system, cell cycle response regulator DivK
VTEPLALLLFERLLPGSQLANRLEDQGYRVKTVPNAESLVTLADEEKPLLVIADAESRANRVCEAIGRLKQNPTTAHIPVIAVVAASGSPRESAARAAGAEMVVTDAAISLHLKQLLDQALHVE